MRVSSHLDCSQTREICEKQEKYFKGKVIIFTVPSLILYQYPVDLLTYWELCQKSYKYLKMEKFGLVNTILSGYGAFKSRETCLCERNENTFTLNSFIYILANVSS